MEDGKEREKGRKAPKKDLAGALELVETGGGGELQTHSLGSPELRGAVGMPVPKSFELMVFATLLGFERYSCERDGKAGKQNGPRSGATAAQPQQEGGEHGGGGNDDPHIGGKRIPQRGIFQEKI